MGPGRPGTRYYHIAGKRFDSLSEAAEFHKVSKPTIHNWCKSEKRTDCWTEPKNGMSNSKPPGEVMDAAEAAGMTPLDYMLKVMRDESEDTKTRAQMAYWAAPYIHKKANDKKTKKDERGDRAKKAGAGKFAPTAPPKLAAVNGKAVK